MRLAVIGGSGHFLYAVEGARRAGHEICACAKGSPEENLDGLEAALSRAGFAPRRYEDYRELLARETPDVAVVNPWFCDNARVSTDCLRAGAHVYSEKPLATRLDDLDALKRAWQASARSLGGMFDLRVSPWFQAIARAVADGEIGEVRLLHGQKSYRLGQRGEPYRTHEHYGGTIPWVAIHAADWMLRLGGVCERVTALESRACNRGHGDLEMTACLLMALENGVMATVSADYLRPEASARHDDDRLRVTGTKGMIEAVDGRVYLENERPKRELTLPERGDPFARFANAIGTEDARRQALEAFAASRVCLLAREAAQTGTWQPVGREA